MTWSQSKDYIVELKNVDRDFAVKDESSRKASAAKALKLQALSKVSLGLTAGEFVFLTGPSGAGKTTLLRLILGLDNPSSGDIYTLGNHMNQLAEAKRRFVRRQIGVIFQDHRLIGALNVAENIELPLRFTPMSKKERQYRVREILEVVEMRRHIYSSVDTLSAGEKQRVGIARALVHCPELIIADEPTGNLDPITARSLIRLLREVKGKGTTVLIATHDMSLVRDFGGRVLEIVSGNFKADKGSVAPNKAYRVPEFWKDERP